MKSIDLSIKLRPYENKWVVLSENHQKVLGFGNTLEEAEREVRKKRQDYIFIKLPPYDVKFVPKNQ
ncbi:hypothetical protein HY373_01515 [Candidatus Berkelbacteria bacterium]|nr:hypothetical protein [Candidatus Berkelbacteria bacterium]MBI4029836.1 hypothetical protein [Candidatus Berkelbacteria bacterium]